MNDTIATADTYREFLSKTELKRDGSLSTAKK